MVPASAWRLAIRPPIGAAICVRPNLPLGYGELTARLCARRVGDLHGDLRGQMILVGDAAGLDEAVGAVFFRPSMSSIRLGHVELRFRAIARQPEVGIVEHGQQLASAYAIAFARQHALEARGNLRDDGHLRSADRACLSTTASRSDRGSRPSRCAPDRSAPFRPWTDFPLQTHRRQRRQRPSASARTNKSWVRLSRLRFRSLFSFAFRSSFERISSHHESERRARVRVRV